MGHIGEFLSYSKLINSIILLKMFLIGCIKMKSNIENLTCIESNQNIYSFLLK